MLEEWRVRADSLGLGMVREHYSVGTDRFVQSDTRRLEVKAGAYADHRGLEASGDCPGMDTALDQAELGNIFNNAKVLFLSGTLNYRLASVIAEFTDNLSFADPIVQFGLPNLLHTLQGS
jgi:hypothetical protein